MSTTTIFAGTLARVALSSLWLLFSMHAAAEADFPRDALKGIDAMRRLPADGFHVVESQGRLLLVSTNGHYVVTGGRVLDLWNQVEVKAVADVDSTLRMPLARMGIDAKELGGLIAGKADAKQRVTAFLDPGSAESKKLLSLLRELGTQYRLDVVFVPAQQQRAGISRALICDRQAALAFLNESSTPAALPDSNTCGVKELERARVTVQLLGITSLPFTVSPNGATVAGTPKNYIEFIAANQEEASP